MANDTVVTTATASSTPSHSTPGSTNTKAISGGAVRVVIGQTPIVLAIWLFKFRRWRDRAITPVVTSKAAGSVEKDVMVRDQDLNKIPRLTAGPFGYSE
jgi:hypothetical protein